MDTPRRGFTLIELLVSTVIIGLLAGLLIPAVHSAREASRRARCASNLHQIGISFENYLITHDRIPEYEFDRGPGDRTGSFVCPTLFEAYPATAGYAQGWVDFTRDEILEETQLPSSEIHILGDGIEVHNGVNLCLHLDWHVAPYRGR